MDLAIQDTMTAGRTTSFQEFTVAGLHIAANNATAARSLEQEPTSLAPLSVDPAPVSTSATSESSMGSISRSSTSLALVKLLCEYPACLLKEDFVSPLLHRTLYTNAVSDMTSLPLTTTAVCCGVGMHVKEGVQFIRRAMDAQTRKLIDEFVSTARRLSGIR
jgi:hypothetical protein